MKRNGVAVRQLLGPDEMEVLGAFVIFITRLKNYVKTRSETTAGARLGTWVSNDEVWEIKKNMDEMLSMMEAKHVTLFKRRLAAKIESTRAVCKIARPDDVENDDLSVEDYMKKIFGWHGESNWSRVKKIASELFKAPGMVEEKVKDAASSAAKEVVPQGMWSNLSTGGTHDYMEVYNTSFYEGPCEERAPKPPQS